MPESSNEQMYLEMMSFVEDLRACLEVSKEVQQMSYEDVTPEIWKQVITLQTPFQMTVQQMIDSMPDVAKIATDPALMAHVDAVRSSD